MPFVNRPSLSIFVSSINLRKEIADGLRIYFNFTLKEYLLYKQEREQADFYTSPEYTSSFKYVAPERQSLDMLTVVKADAAGTGPAANADQTDSQTSSGDLHPPPEEKAKRRLRSYKNEESEFLFDIGLPSVAKGDNCKSRLIYLLFTIRQLQ